MRQSKSFNDILGTIKSGSIKPVMADTESIWRATWDSNALEQYDHLLIAVLGGALADRLAWVFHSGYQGMMRYAFPRLPLQGWASYLVAEDRTGELPGTQLVREGNQYRLNGFKSWVAAADHVDHLVITTKLENTAEKLLLHTERCAKGVVITSRDAPGFLSELSQGFAAFENVAVEPQHIFQRSDLPLNFAQSEAHHVLIALNAFMLNHCTQRDATTDLIASAEALLLTAEQIAAQRSHGSEAIRAIADLDTATTALAAKFGDFIAVSHPELYPLWSKDQGLIRMFSRGLQKQLKSLA